MAESRIGSIESAPFAVMLGIKIEHAADGIARARMPFNPKLLNAGPPEVPIHGGAIASLIDLTACAAVWSLPETKRSSTVGMTVNFCAAASLSDLVATAKVRRKGRRLASLSVEVRDQTATLIADALVTYKIA